MKRIKYRKLAAVLLSVLLAASLAGCDLEDDVEEILFEEDGSDKNCYIDEDCHADEDCYIDEDCYADEDCYIDEGCYDYEDCYTDEYGQEYFGEDEGYSGADTGHGASETGNDPITPDISFTTRDLDGNTVKSEDIFEQNEITMVNVWATWCGYCLGEMSELEKINNRIASRNCAIIGICGDADSSAGVAEAKEIIKDTGVTYLNLRPFDGWENVFDMNGWPSSFFVDKNGKIVAEPIYGAGVKVYEDHIYEALNANTSQEVEDVGSGDSYKNSDGVYRIIVVNENSEPVKGAMVQFCTDDTCRVAETDSSGAAIFSDDPPGKYEVHVLKHPRGYKENSHKYKTEPYYSDMFIILEKK